MDGLKAHLSLGKNGGLIAQLERGGRIVAVDARKMGEQLRLAGVTAESLTVTDWKTAPDHAPTSGQIIVIKAALRGCRASGEVVLDRLFQQHHEVLKGLADSDAEKSERENLVHSTPISFFEGRGYYVRQSDIPEPYRSRFVADSMGSTFEMIDGEPLHFLNDWFAWLEATFSNAAKGEL